MGLQKIKRTPAAKNIFFLRKFYIFILFVVLALLILYLLPQTEKIDKSSEEKILKVAMREQAVQYFTKNKNYNVSVVKLDAKNITSLAEEFPALYGELPKADVYQVRYTSNGDSLIVILDKNLKVLKYFKFYAVNLP
ncbi:MAG: hypothetical protein QW802_01015 [Candidatus Altiarchaeota archaeon]